MTQSTTDIAQSLRLAVFVRGGTSGAESVRSLKEANRQDTTAQKRGKVPEWHSLSVARE